MGASASQLESCFEGAAISYIATTAGVEEAAARALLPHLPEGQQMVRAIREAGTNADEAKRHRIDRDMMYHSGPWHDV